MVADVGETLGLGEVVVVVVVVVLVVVVVVGFITVVVVVLEGEIITTLPVVDGPFPVNTTPVFTLPVSVTPVEITIHVVDGTPFPVTITFAVHILIRFGT